MTDDQSKKFSINPSQHSGSLEILTNIKPPKTNLRSFLSVECIKEPKLSIWSGSLFIRQKEKIKRKQEVFRFKGGGFKGMILNTQRIQGSLPKINAKNRKKGHTKKISQNEGVTKKIYLPFVYRSVSQLGCFELLES